MRTRSHIPLILLCLATAACGDDPQPGNGTPDAAVVPDAVSPCAVAGAPSIEIGVPDPVTFVDYKALTGGGEIPLSSNGQTFLAVQFWPRVRNMGQGITFGVEVTFAPAMGSPVWRSDMRPVRTDPSWSVITVSSLSPALTSTVTEFAGRYPSRRMLSLAFPGSTSWTENRPCSSVTPARVSNVL